MNTKNKNLSKELILAPETFEIPLPHGFLEFYLDYEEYLLQISEQEDVFLRNGKFRKEASFDKPSLALKSLFKAEHQKGFAFLDSKQATRGAKLDYLDFFDSVIVL